MPFVISTRSKTSLPSGFPIAWEHWGGGVHIPLINKIFEPPPSLILLPYAWCTPHYKLQSSPMKTGDFPTPEIGAASLATHITSHSFHLN